MREAGGAHRNACPTQAVLLFTSAVLVLFIQVLYSATVLQQASIGVVNHRRMATFTQLAYTPTTLSRWAGVLRAHAAGCSTTQQSTIAHVHRLTNRDWCPRVPQPCRPCRRITCSASSASTCQVVRWTLETSHPTEDEARAEGSTALIRKVLQQYEREGKLEESQRLRKLFEVEQLQQQEVCTHPAHLSTHLGNTPGGAVGPV